MELQSIIVIIFLLFEIEPGLAGGTNITVLGSEPICIEESKLNMSTVHLVTSKDLKEFSLESCISQCLETEPNTVYVMISHYDASIFRDSFNCICGLEGSVRGVEQVTSSRCSVPCPAGQYQCADARSDLLRVYCVREECEGGELCDHHDPYGVHGCLRPADVAWDGAINLVDYHHNHLDCVWECKRKLFQPHLVIAKKVGDKLSCSCLSTSNIERRNIISSEFCSKLEIDTSYFVHCSGDLNDGVDQHDCLDPHLGCVFEDLYPANFSALIRGLEYPEPSLCQRLCAASLADAATSGVLFKPDQGVLECRCSSVFPTVESLGPRGTCSTLCSGRPCGGSSPQPAFSVYCISEAVGGSVSTPDLPSSSRSSLDQLRRGILTLKQNLHTSLVLIVALLAGLLGIFLFVVFKKADLD